MRISANESTEEGANFSCFTTFSFPPARNRWTSAQLPPAPGSKTRVAVTAALHPFEQRYRERGSPRWFEQESEEGVALTHGRQHQLSGKEAKEKKRKKHVSHVDVCALFSHGGGVAGERHEGKRAQA